jgi:hypothetical protein
MTDIPSPASDCQGAAYFGCSWVFMYGGIFGFICALFYSFSDLECTYVYYDQGMIDEVRKLTIQTAKLRKR